MLRSRKGGLLIKNIISTSSFCMKSICCLLYCVNFSYAQERTSTKDLSDVLKQLLKKKADTSAIPKKPGILVLPSIGYNPSLGLVMGAKSVMSFQLGSKEKTTPSVVGVEAVYTSKDILSLQARHNIFLANNRYNFQGNWQLSRFGIVDFGIGAGNERGKSETFNLDEFPIEIGDSAFPITYNYFRLQEKVYKKIAPHFFIGGGISINMHSKITDEKLSSSFSTPHQLYSFRNNYNPLAYNLNGLLFSLQYSTREHPIRSYGGIYAELTFGTNLLWLGSTQKASQLQYEFRKYWSLSKQRPDKVLAIWHWASFMLSGNVPYLDLPGTGSDPYYRMGRGYTIGRIKGPSYAFFETEYRFPISNNQLISGICFFSLQTASDDLQKKIFQFWEPAAGTGLRILFQKQSRSTICIDFAKGRGSSGIFFGLNEAF
ncbi:MAG: hypothetical protein EBX50_02855 [Chitinophagia bacterium]|nr:hypothetical protein [Chitinophagia bacterium]